MLDFTCYFRLDHDDGSGKSADASNKKIRSFGCPNQEENLQASMLSIFIILLFFVRPRRSIDFYEKKTVGCLIKASRAGRI